LEKKVVKNKVEKILKDILKIKKENVDKFDMNCSLYEDGMGLDSLDAATFSAILEQQFGKDPYNSGNFPHTIEDVIEFYINE